MVIGYGNLLRGDDGVGPAVVDRLAARHPGIRTACVPLLTPELAPALADETLVVFVDARIGERAGFVRVEPVEPEEATGAFGHLLSPRALLALTKQLYGRCPQAVQVSVGGEAFEIGAPMSDAVAAALPLAADIVLKIATAAVPAGATRGIEATRPSPLPSSPTR